MRDQILQHIIAALNQRQAQDFFFREEDIQLYLANYFIQTTQYNRVFIEYHVPKLDNYPWANNKIYIDIVLEHNGIFYPIEIKYKTTKQKLSNVAIFGNSVYDMNLQHHGAKDIGCYDFWKDIKRIEIFEDTFPNCERGVVLFVSNDLTYQKPPSNYLVSYAQFSINNGRNVPANKTLNWNGNPSVAIGRPQITTRYNYIINWTAMNIDQHHYILT